MTGTPYSTEDAVVAGHQVHFHRAGSPDLPALLFLHGSGPGVSALANWEGALGRLSDRFHCIAPDVVGFGDSDHPADPPQGMRKFTDLRVANLLALLDHLCLEQVDLVGNSMGGLISLVLMYERPERFGRATLMGSGGLPFEWTPELLRGATFYDDPSPELLGEMMASFLYDPAAYGDLDALAKQRYEVALRPGVRRSHLATFGGDPYLFTPEQLAEIRHPIQLVHGRDDRIIPNDVSVQFQRHLPNADLHILAHCGHWLQLEHPDQFDQLVASFHTGG